MQARKLYGVSQETRHDAPSFGRVNSSETGLRIKARAFARPHRLPVLLLLLLVVLAVYAASVFLHLHMYVGNSSTPRHPANGMDYYTDYLDGLPPADSDCRPHYDLVVAVFVVGGKSWAAQDEIARVRKAYARYGDRIVLQDFSQAQPRSSSSNEVSTVPPLTLKVVLIVGPNGVPENVQLPETGILRGDIFHVNIREGYRFLSDKAKAMMGLYEHLRWAESEMWLDF